MGRLRSRLRALIEGFNHFQAFLAGSLLLALMIFMVYESMARYLFRWGLTGSTTIAGLMLLLSASLAVGYTHKVGANVKVDILTARLHPRSRAVLGIITSALTLLFCGFFVWAGASFSWRAWEGNFQSTPPRSIPYFGFILVMTIGAISLLLQTLVLLRKKQPEAASRKGPTTPQS